VWCLQLLASDERLAGRAIEKMRRELEENATFDITDLEMPFSKGKAGLESSALFDQVGYYAL
jgi:hypothetical protein